MTKIIFFPGSFDPFTNGHLALAKKVLPICDQLIIAIGSHAKKQAMFAVEKRQQIIEELFSGENKISVQIFSGLLVDAAKSADACAIVRGIRNTSDMEYEMQMVEMNEKMQPDIPTLFIPATGENRAISATLVRQISAMGGDVAPFVPDIVAKLLTNKEQL